MRLGLLHPTFDAFGGAEALLLAQARELEGLGHSVEGIALGRRIDERPESGFDRFVIHTVGRSGAPDAPWTFWDRLRCGSRLARLIGRYDGLLAANFPANALAGHASVEGPTIWYTNEPPRRLYRRTTHPRLEAAHETHQELAAVNYYRERLEKEARLDRWPHRRGIRDWDRAGIARVDRIWVNSDFTRGLVRRIYGRTDAEVVYPIVPGLRRYRLVPAGRDRCG